MSVGWFIRFRLVLPYFPVTSMAETEATVLPLLPLAVIIIIIIIIIIMFIDCKWVDTRWQWKWNGIPKSVT